MTHRESILTTWLTEQGNLQHFRLESMLGDASFRRYFRVHHEQGSYVVMDAPPDKENCLSFVSIAKALRSMGLHTPEIIASDLKQGFLLLTDFGDDLYLKKLNENNANDLYSKALDALSILQMCRHIEGWQLPLFTENFMRQELELFKEWFLQRYLKLNLSFETEKNLANCFDFLAQTSAKQEYVFMHRDFHSANLMVLPHEQVGILDFQDAFIGPVTYDLVSLLRDCYIVCPDVLVKKFVLNYRAKLNLSVSDDEFLFWFDVMGMQRHLKTLLTFSRKFCRDQNKNYLQHIPRTLEYLRQVSRQYSECKILYDFLSEINSCVP